MAQRLEHIKHRLECWAIWASRGAGLGFKTKSVLASEVWSRGSYNHVPIPVSEEEAWETEKAVMALKLTRSHLHVMILHVYLNDLGVRETAKRMQRAESTIKAQLVQADHAINAWLEARAVEVESKRKAAAPSITAKRGSFTT
ncbi:hypothetical protein PMI14_05831 [Acidovorax sp. CF316]|uniref:hypothetical protein n=1 Tax=Acidovorax sp. CF316 TaxID=1144317 RepID=UPI00026BC7F7|nr:hypothetical protein [Acidovorax sp. CF316]EJE49588.1 hypothetical protein PMI14_05831 [Acidovorax sp. CF316]